MSLTPPVARPTTPGTRRAAPGDRRATPSVELTQPRLLAPGEGDHISFLGSVLTVKIGGDATGRNLSVLECLAPAGFRPPPHRHDLEDELLLVLEGEVGFWCAGQEATYGPGGFVWCPRGLAHRLEVSAHGPARMLQVTTPAQFEDFALEVGQRVSTARLPEPTEPDVDALARVAADFQIEILPDG
jgi:quercetin dioxygenase-like cupin family protein